MSTSSPIRLGLIGLGNMGSLHLQHLQAGKVPQFQLTAVADQAHERLRALPENLHAVTDPLELIQSDWVDAVVIATPHFSHVPLGQAALHQGLHTLLEKPIAVHKQDALKLLKTYEELQVAKPIFAAMFNQRTDPRYQKLRDLLQGGTLGEVRRINWVITDWFRTETYYRLGDWRATWRGEGGGVLLNQCPHQLDLLWWLFGSPQEVWAQCRFGQWHDIEVEDDVTAVLTYPNGATCSFVTTTGEAPGTNRLEIACDGGHLLVDDHGIQLCKNLEPAHQFRQHSSEPFGKPQTTEEFLPFPQKGPQHVGILQNFAEAILGQSSLLAPALEGIHSVELANAMLLSTFTQQGISLPMNAEVYARELNQRIQTSRYQEGSQPSGPVADMTRSF